MPHPQPSVPDPVAATRRWLEERGLAADQDPTDRDRVASAASQSPPVGVGTPAEEDLARQVVLRKLAVQSRTRAELARALAAKQVPEAAAASVLDRMAEVGLIDDAAFAHDWVESRQQRRHLSRAALRLELQSKGVAAEEIDEALQPVDRDQEYAAALSLARRRYATMGHLTREVAYRRLAAVLQRRGFGGSLVARVLHETLDGVNRA